MKSGLNELVILGASGHAKVVADLVRAQGSYQVIGFVDTLAPERMGDAFYDSVILDSNILSMEVRGEGNCVFPSFGDNASRRQWVQRLVDQGWRVPSLVHPSATVSESATLGSGTVVMAGAVVQADVIIEDACIVNTGACVDHDCHLGSGVHLAPGCILAGNIEVGELSMIGIGTIVRDRIIIGSNVTVGAGSVVISDLADNCLAYGVPATVRAPKFPYHKKN